MEIRVLGDTRCFADNPSEQRFRILRLLKKRTDEGGNILQNPISVPLER